MEPDRPPLLSRLRLKNYKSISTLDVRFGALNFFVGRNGAGKSNVLDSIRFVSDALRTSLGHAVLARGGIDDVRRRSTGHPHNFTIALDLAVAADERWEYQFEIKAEKGGRFSVKQESLRRFDERGTLDPFFSVRDGVAKHSSEVFPAVASDRLSLVAASGLPEFRGVYDALLSVGFYNLNPTEIREVQTPDASQILRRDGANLASVIRRLTVEDPRAKSRINDFLSVIVPGITDFSHKALGHRETIEFRQEVEGAKSPWSFSANSMSDGTLRVLGILVAAMQISEASRTVRSVAIEEPETALHPAALPPLVDALRECAEETQVLVTTHSPDLLRTFCEDTDTLLVVKADRSTTRVAPPDEVSMDLIRSHLIDPGELLTQDQLEPTAIDVGPQGDLFDWRVTDAG